MIFVDDSPLSDEDLRTFSVVWFLLSRECSAGRRVFLEELAVRCRLELRRRRAVIADLERGLLVGELDEREVGQAGALLEVSTAFAEAAEELRLAAERAAGGQDL